MFRKSTIALSPLLNGGTLLGDLVTDADYPDLPATARIALIGIDDGSDEFGSAADAVRHQLYSLVPDIRDESAYRKTMSQFVDLGDLIGDTVQFDERLGPVIAELLARDVLPIVVSRQRSASYGHFLGYVNSVLPVSIFSFDAHAEEPLDMHGDELVRTILEHPSEVCKRMQLVGLQPQTTARPQVDFITEHNGEVIWARDVNAELVRDLFAYLSSDVMCSFDLDVVNDSMVGAVRRPNAEGISTSVLYRSAFEAGRCSRTTSLDVVGYEPKKDRDHQTARVAAMVIWNFLHGFSHRW